jgi:hypothetical protein
MKIAPTLGFLFVASMFAPMAWSQCTTGVDTGGQCIPPDVLQGTDQSQQAQPLRPQIVWASRYGAVAYDSVSGAEGHTTDQTSKSQSESTAVSLCAQHGGKSCKVLVSYYNQCAAIAQVQGGGQMGTGRSLHSQQAEQLAMEACGQAQTTCKIVYSACSLPVRVQ